MERLSTTNGDPVDREKEQLSSPCCRCSRRSHSVLQCECEGRKVVTNYRIPLQTRHMY